MDKLTYELRQVVNSRVLEFFHDFCLKHEGHNEQLLRAEWLDEVFKPAPPARPSKSTCYVILKKGKNKGKRCANTIARADTEKMHCVKHHKDAAAGKIFDYFDDAPLDEIIREIETEVDSEDVTVSDEESVDGDYVTRLVEEKEAREEDLRRLRDAFDNRAIFDVVRGRYVHKPTRVVVECTGLGDVSIRGVYTDEGEIRSLESDDDDLVKAAGLDWL